ncbi:MAG TPA: hypothetical protein PLX35_06370 [Cyclobacteriaceae bacterium]|nr:hypothetical protein [Cyclobacteriaceae bacterium]
MSKNTIDPRTSILIIMILAAAAFRVLQANNTFSIFTNLTPAGAMALFGGTYFRNRWKALLIPVAAMWISDIFINRLLYFDHWVFFYSGSWLVYGTFALMAVIGFFISKVNLTTVALAGVGAALLHWVVSDFGVWLGGTDFTTGLPFTKDWSGLVRCYTFALPFLRNMLIGNLLFCGVMFGSFEWMQRRFPSLAPERVRSQE